MCETFTLTLLCFSFVIGAAGTLPGARALVEFRAERGAGVTVVGQGA